MQTTLAIFTGKLISLFSKKLKLGGGSAAPGLFALRIDPELVEGLSKKIPRNVVITGTNGKTTTARMLAHFASESGLKVIRNHTGSNLERGIASTLISSISWGSKLFNPWGWIGSDLGIWEIDEAAFNTVASKLNPDIVVFLNVFRDQLDRYGEVDTVVKGWIETLKKLPKKTIVLVNGDDANCAKLKSAFKGEIYQFGVKDYKIVGESISRQKEQENLDFEAKNVKLNGLTNSKFSLIINRKSYLISLPLPGIYHIYNALAALVIAHSLSLPIHKSFKNFHPAFGRFEKLDFGYIFLIKNPSGATQVFQTIAPQIKPDDRLLLALNDNLADGTDVSWIWDAGFENLKSQMSNVKCFASGTRAYDLAVRLKYAGFDPENIIVEEDMKNALKEAKKGLKGRLFILPTYTAMLELQSILVKSGIKKNYWEEDI